MPPVREQPSEDLDNRPMRARAIWELIKPRGLYMNLGRTPWATVASKLSTDPSSSA